MATTSTTRRRDRRSVPGPTQPNRSNPSVQQLNPGAKHSLPLLVLFLISIAFISVAAVFFFTNRSSGDSNQSSSVFLKKSVHERGLVRTDIRFDEIIAENGRIWENRSQRNFPNPVLAYVTPWNSKGYDMAKLFANKLTHVSPVWYELKSDGKGLILEGHHNADIDWISHVRASGISLILPRIVLEVLPADFLQKKKLKRDAIDLIVTECKDMGYDGIVLESWSRWAAYGILQDRDMRDMGLEFIKEVGDALHSVKPRADYSNQLEFVFVIPAPRSQKLAVYDFRPEDLRQLNDVVDGFSLMTYDFSGPYNPGPNAPLDWIRSVLKVLVDGGSSNASQKIFLGTNFYGNDFTLSEGAEGGAVTGRDFLSLLEKYRPQLQWDERSAEHFFLYSSNNIRHAVFYPSLMSISARLDEAKAWGVGLSIWEIGQGLDYFFDLL